jgi:O-antigen/teichoic acid export membrane protein
MIEEDALFGEVPQPNPEPALLGGDTGRQSAAWDLRHAPKNYITLVGAQAVVSLLSFTSVWMATRYLGPAGYGGVVAFIAAAQVAMLIAVNWTSLSVARFGCEEFVSTGRVAATFWTRLIILIPNLILVLAAAPLWLPILARILNLPPNSTWLVLSLLLVNTWWIHIQQALQGAKLMRLQASLLVVERILILLVLCFLALNGTISIVKVGWLYVLGPTGASLIGLLRLSKLIWPVRIDASILRQILRFSIPLIPTALIGYLSTNYLDALFIAHFLSQAKLGIYAVAYQLAGLTQQLPLLAGTLLMPLFVTLQTGRQEDRSERFVREVLPPISLLWAVACTLLAATGSYLAPLVFGSKFEETGLLLWPLMAASAFAGPNLLGYAPFSNARSMTYIAMMAAAVSAVVNMLLDFVLIPKFGLTGCAWATTAAYAANLFVVIGLIHWRVPAARTWSLQTTLPTALGAAYASWRGLGPGAVLAGLSAAVLIGLFHQSAFVAGLKVLREYRRKQRLNAAQISA